MDGSVKPSFFHTLWGHHNQKDMGGKNTENKSVGQPIFKQLIDCIPKSKFDALVERYQVCRYYQRFTTWDQLLALFVWGTGPLRFDGREM